MIEIKEEFKVPGTNITLEAGDKIQVIRESNRALEEIVGGYIGMDKPIEAGYYLAQDIKEIALRKMDAFEFTDFVKGLAQGTKEKS